MRPWEGIRQLIDGPMSPRHAPAVGSIVVHGFAIAVLAAMIGVSKNPPIAPPDAQFKTMLEVVLLADLPIPEAPGVRPPPALHSAVSLPLARAEASIETAPPAPRPHKTPNQSKTTPQPLASASIALDRNAGVHLGPTPFAGRKGLGGLVQDDPCKPRIGIKPEDCPTNWAARIGSEPSRMATSKDEQKRYYAEFMPTCPWKVGCEPGDGVLLNGARSFGLKSPMASGAASLQGIHDLVGRLPQVPDFVDPGFGD